MLEFQRTTALNQLVFFIWNYRFVASFFSLFRQKLQTNNRSNDIKTKPKDNKCTISQFTVKIQKKTLENIGKHCACEIPLIKYCSRLWAVEKQSVKNRFGDWNVRVAWTYTPSTFSWEWMNERKIVRYFLVRICSLVD